MEILVTPTIAPGVPFSPGAPPSPCGSNQDIINHCIVKSAISNAIILRNCNVAPTLGPEGPVSPLAPSRPLKP